MSMTKATLKLSRYEKSLQAKNAEMEMYNGDDLDTGTRYDRQIATNREFLKAMVHPLRGGWFIVGDQT